MNMTWRVITNPGQEYIVTPMHFDHDYMLPHMVTLVDNNLICHF
jgi:hypothetical protein